MIYWMRQVVFFVRALPLYLFYIICRLIPLPWAMAFGGGLARLMSPLLRRSGIAHRNLSTLYPTMTRRRRFEIVQSMWDNIGRVGAEYAHIDRFARKYRARLEIEGEDILKELRDLRCEGKPALLIGAHLANWQMISIACQRHDLPVMQFYRPDQNPYVEALFQKTQHYVVEDTIQKGQKGLRELIAALKQGKHVLILVDQRNSKGLQIPFLGRPALTSPLVVELAQRFNCPLVPVQVIRQSKSGMRGSCFKVVFHPFLPVEGSPGAVMQRVHRYLEQWITAHPGQWFWLHDRWKP